MASRVCMSEIITNIVEFSRSTHTHTHTNMCTHAKRWKERSEVGPWKKFNKFAAILFLFAINFISNNKTQSIKGRSLGHTLTNYPLAMYCHIGAHFRCTNEVECLHTVWEICRQPTIHFTRQMRQYGTCTPSATLLNELRKLFDIQSVLIVSRVELRCQRFDCKCTRVSS